jgi:hypothetical protein
MEVPSRRTSSGVGELDDLDMEEEHIPSCQAGLTLESRVVGVDTLESERLDSE